MTDAKPSAPWPLGAHVLMAALLTLLAFGAGWVGIGLAVVSATGGGRSHEQWAMAFLGGALVLVATAITLLIRGVVVALGRS